MDCPKRMPGFPYAAALAGPDSWRADHTCSFCGSLSPEEFLRRVKEGEKVVPTDKNYKVYLGNSKFYFDHFSDDQKREFVELCNSSQVKFGEPGYFYVLPFFMRRSQEAA